MRVQSGSEFVVPLKEQVMLGGNDDKCCLALPQNQPPEFDLCSMGPHYKTYISL